MSREPGPALVIALTGGIASGKTAVSDLFEKLGVDVIDTDIIARELVVPRSEGLNKIIDEFGQSMLTPNGELDRQKLRALIFSDETKRLALETILHPMIWAKARERVAASVTPYCIVVVPLLSPKNRPGWVDRVLVVDTDPNTQLERVMARDQVDSAEASATIASQIDRNVRLEFADDVIENNDDLLSLEPQVLHLHAKYKRLSNAVID